MKNRKGFTLIELIAVIIILGLVLIIAIPFFTGSLKEFRNDYYENLSGNVLNAGKEFFTDNRLYLPHNYLDSAIVRMETLEKENYIDNVKDYNGATCDVKDSYVIAIRISKDEVIYDSCIKCSDDEYDNTEGKTTCSSGWREGEGFTMMEYKNPEKVYVYKGTSRSDLKEKLLLYPKIIRCRGKAGICEEELKWVSGEGEDGVVPLYPVDMEVVDTNKVGTYVVHYKYENYANLINRDVIVYEHTGVTVSAKKYNNKYVNTIKSSGLVENVESDYDLSVTNRDDWAQQKIKFTFNHSFGSDAPSGLYVTHYQIFLNNRWEDYCDPKKGSNYCVKEETRQMDEKVRFRIVDSLGNIGQPTEELGIRMERGVPTCTIIDSGTKGDNDWYVSDVTISFTSKTDVAGGVPYSGATAPLSGILEYGITKGDKDAKETGLEQKDGESITWYGYVEDKANNLGKCSVTFKRDTAPPKCSLTTSGTRGTNSWYKRKSDSEEGTVTGLFSNTSDSLSQVATYYFDENKKDTISTKTSVVNKTWTATIIDKAGNVGTCDIHFNFDNKNPTCVSSGGSTWINKDVTIKGTCSDTGGSGCKEDITKTYKDEIDSSTESPGTVYDNAGNKVVCPADRTVQIDKTDPSCSLTEPGPDGKNGWYKSESVTITASYQDNGKYQSKVAAKGVDKSRGSTNGKTSVEFTENGASLTAYCYVKDNAGNSGSNSLTIKKDDGTDAGPCVPTGGNSTWKNIASVKYGIKLQKEPISGCSGGCDIEPSTLSISVGDSVKTFRGSISAGWMLNSGAIFLCTVQHDYDAYSDRKSPTCVATKSNTGTTSGVTVTVTCDDGTDQSGCVSSGDDQGSHTGVTSDTTYTVKDAVGNSGTCSVSVTSSQSCSYSDWEHDSWCDSKWGTDSCSSYNSTGTLVKYEYTKGTLASAGTNEGKYECCCEKLTRTQSCVTVYN